MLANKDPASPLTVALIGNPNTGKSTLFNSLADVRQHVGNYPGATVERKSGQFAIAGQMFDLVDLPGTYSLAPRSPDEMVTVDALLGRLDEEPEPDVVVCVLDASRLEQNLYLFSQVLELGRPTVLVLNKMDLAEAQGTSVDVAGLSSRLGVPVVAMQAHRKIGLETLRQTIQQAVGQPAREGESPFPEAFRREVADLKTALEPTATERLPRYLIERLLLDSGGWLEQAGLPDVDDAVMQQVRQARTRLAEAGFPVPAVETTSRYDWAARTLDGLVKTSENQSTSGSDRLDGILMHRFWGGLVFALLMTLVFQAIFTGAEPLMEGIEDGIGWLAGRLDYVVPEGVLRSLLQDGMLAGVGAVLVFLPQILILFLFIALLEDCGYMARAAYLMDRLMSRIGLSGKSFIPLLSSFACAIPGIMATRVIEDRRDRLTTMLIAPLMTCSARLPVYTLLIAAFIPSRRLLGGWIGLQGLTLLGLYVLGLVVAVVAAFVLKRTLLRGETPPFVMELPPYKWPSLVTIVRRVGENGWAFLRGAGTLIFIVSILVWAAAYFPRDPAVEAEVRAAYATQIEALQQRAAELAQNDERPQAADPAAWAQLEQEQSELKATLSRHVAGAYMEHSYLARAGRLIEPAVEPLGWDWRIGCAVIASFPAREVVVSTLGVIYHLGEGQDEKSESLRDTLRAATWPGTDRKVFNIPVALSLMVFFALCAQCAATLAIMRHETGTWRWPFLTFTYMTILAYAGAWLTYQIGMQF